MNLVMLLKLAQESKASNIDEMNSQVCESFFRRLRSYTGVESTIVNCTLKSFTTRFNKMQFEEKVVSEISDEIEFPQKSETKRLKGKKTTK
jgi:hypothetical protein